MSQIYDPVKVATTVNINLGTAFSLGVSKIDNVIVGNGDRVLVKSQSNRIENGIYTLNSSGFLVRATDFAAASSQLGGRILFVQEGDTFADTGWVLANNGSAVVGTSEIYFETFTVNQKLQGAELPSSIVLRSEKGYPLTNDELDNNFKFLSLSLTQKLNVVDFTPEAIVERINELSAEEANLDAFALQGLFPSYGTDTNTIAVRDEAGTITATNFFGALEGNADTATLADRATIANNVDGVVQVIHGGTGSSTASDARTNLAVVGRAGDTMTGKLTIESGIQEIVNPALNLVPVTSNPLTIVNGDIWTTNTNIFYRLNNVTKTIAPLESPTFTGSVIAPNPEFVSNSGAVATTKFVQEHVTALNTSINLKSNIDAPTFTGDAKAVTAAVANETTSIATTLYVKNKVTDILSAYYNKTQVDGLLTTLDTNLSNDIDGIDAKATEALERSGLPVGSVAYFAGNAIPSGWLKCNGAQISTTGYAKLFQAIGYTYGGQGNFFRLPDLRGEFLRGWDDGRGVDANRALGSFQADEFKSHKHDLYGNDRGSNSGQTYAPGLYRDDPERFTGNPRSGFKDVIDFTGGVETRPRNVAMMACIKAFGAIDDLDVIQATAVLNNINNKVDKTGDTMTGFLTLATNPTSALHAATKSYVDSSISTISLTPGPQGAQGPQGPQGPAGLNGTSYTFTYGNTQYSTSGFTNIVGSWSNDSNYFDVFPPAGKTVNNLVAFIPSIAVLYYSGVVNGDDATRCTWTIFPASTNNLGGLFNIFNTPGRIRVYVQNTEQRSTPAANWLAIWS
jgi:hypothetical protein